jgi:RHS repeat-associated protein
VDELFARTTSGGTSAWYMTDRLGSVRDVVSSAGSNLDHIAYDGFGNIVSESNSGNGDRFKWTAREWDGTSGLQFNRGRYLEPSVGRWSQLDPIGFVAGSANLYIYVSNSSTITTDPSGQYASFVEDYCHYFNPVNNTYGDAADTVMTGVKWVGWTMMVGAGTMLGGMAIASTGVVQWISGVAVTAARTAAQHAFLLLQRQIALRAAAIAAAAQRGSQVAQSAFNRFQYQADQVLQRSALLGQRFSQWLQNASYRLQPGDGAYSFPDYDARLMRILRAWHQANRVLRTRSEIT